MATATERKKQTKAPGGKHNRPSRVSAAERRRQAVQLRAMGRTFAEIAEALGYAGESGARNAVNEQLARLESQDVKDADLLRRLEAERIDLARRSIAQAVMQGNLAAIDRWQRLSESFRKLYGLDAPAQLDVSVDEQQSVVFLLPPGPRHPQLEVIEAEARMLTDGAQQGDGPTPLEDTP